MIRVTPRALFLFLLFSLYCGGYVDVHAQIIVKAKSEFCQEYAKKVKEQKAKGETPDKPWDCSVPDDCNATSNIQSPYVASAGIAQGGGKIEARCTEGGLCVAYRICGNVPNLPEEAEQISDSGPDGTVNTQDPSQTLKDLGPQSQLQPSDVPDSKYQGRLGEETNNALLGNENTPTGKITTPDGQTTESTRSLLGSDAWQPKTPAQEAAGWNSGLIEKNNPFNLKPSPGSGYSVAEKALPGLGSKVYSVWSDLTGNTFLQSGASAPQALSPQYQGGSSPFYTTPPSSSAIGQYFSPPPTPSLTTGGPLTMGEGLSQATSALWESAKATAQEAWDKVASYLAPPDTAFNEAENAFPIAPETATQIPLAQSLDDVFGQGFANQGDAAQNALRGIADADNQGLPGTQSGAVPESRTRDVLENTIDALEQGRITNNKDAYVDYARDTIQSLQQQAQNGLQAERDASWCSICTRFMQTLGATEASQEAASLAALETRLNTATSPVNNEPFVLGPDGQQLMNRLGGPGSGGDSTRITGTDPGATAAARTEAAELQQLASQIEASNPQEATRLRNEATALLQSTQGSLINPSGVPVGSDAANPIAGLRGSASGQSADQGLPGGNTGVPTGSDAANPIRGSLGGQTGSVDQGLPGNRTGVPIGSRTGQDSIEGAPGTQTGKTEQTLMGNPEGTGKLGGLAGRLADAQAAEAAAAAKLQEAANARKNLANNGSISSGKTVSEIQKIDQENLAATVKAAETRAAEAENAAKKAAAAQMQQASLDEQAMHKGLVKQQTEVERVVQNDKSGALEQQTVKQVQTQYVQPQRQNLENQIKAINSKLDAYEAQASKLGGKLSTEDFAQYRSLVDQRNALMPKYQEAVAKEQAAYKELAPAFEKVGQTARDFREAFNRYSAADADAQAKLAQFNQFNPIARSVLEPLQQAQLGYLKAYDRMSTLQQEYNVRTSDQKQVVADAAYLYQARADDASRRALGYENDYRQGPMFCAGVACKNYTDQVAAAKVERAAAARDQRLADFLRSGDPAANDLAQMKFSESRENQFRLAQIENKIAALQDSAQSRAFDSLQQASREQAQRQLRDDITRLAQDGPLTDKEANVLRQSQPFGMTPDEIQREAAFRSIQERLALLDYDPTGFAQILRKPVDAMLAVNEWFDPSLAEQSARLNETSDMTVLRNAWKAGLPAAESALFLTPPGLRAADAVLGPVLNPVIKSVTDGAIGAGRYLGTRFAETRLGSYLTGDAIPEIAAMRAAEDAAANRVAELNVRAASLSNEAQSLVRSGESLGVRSGEVSRTESALNELQVTETQIYKATGKLAPLESYRAPIVYEAPASISEGRMGVGLSELIDRAPVAGADITPSVSSGSIMPAAPAFPRTSAAVSDLRSVSFSNPVGPVAQFAGAVALDIGEAILRGFRSVVGRFAGESVSGTIASDASIDALLARTPQAPSSVGAGVSAEVIPQMERTVAQKAAMQSLAQQEGKALNSEFALNRWMGGNPELAGTPADIFASLADGSSVERALVREAAEGNPIPLVQEIIARTASPSAAELTSNQAIGQLKSIGKSTLGTQVAVKPGASITLPSQLNYHGLDTAPGVGREVIDEMARTSAEWLNRPTINDGLESIADDVQRNILRDSFEKKLSSEYPEANALNEQNKYRTNSISGTRSQIEGNADFFIKPTIAKGLENPAADVLVAAADRFPQFAGRSAYDSLSLAQKSEVISTIDGITRTVFDVVSASGPLTRAQADAMISQLPVRPTFTQRGGTQARSFNIPVPEEAAVASNLGALARESGLLLQGNQELVSLSNAAEEQANTAARLFAAGNETEAEVAAIAARDLVQQLEAGAPGTFEKAGAAFFERQEIAGKASTVARDMLFDRYKDDAGLLQIVLRDIARNPSLEQVAGTGEMGIVKGYRGTQSRPTFGVLHIADRHPVMLNRIGEVMTQGKAIPNSKGGFELTMPDPANPNTTLSVILGTSWNGERLLFPVTAYRHFNVTPSLEKVTSDALNAARAIRAKPSEQRTSVVDNEDVGPISLRWGSINGANGYGLAAIDPGIDPYLGELMLRGKIVPGGSPGKSSIIETADARGVITYEFSDSGKMTAWLNSASLKRMSPPSLVGSGPVSEGLLPTSADLSLAKAPADTSLIKSISPLEGLSSDDILAVIKDTSASGQTSRAVGSDVRLDSVASIVGGSQAAAGGQFVPEGAVRVPEGLGTGEGGILSSLPEPVRRAAQVIVPAVRLVVGDVSGANLAIGRINPADSLQNAGFMSNPATDLVAPGGPISFNLSGPLARFNPTLDVADRPGGGGVTSASRVAGNNPVDATKNVLAIVRENRAISMLGSTQERLVTAQGKIAQAEQALAAAEGADTELEALITLATAKREAEIAHRYILQTAAKATRSRDQATLLKNAVGQSNLAIRQYLLERQGYTKALRTSGDVRSAALRSAVENGAVAEEALSSSRVWTNQAVSVEPPSPQSIAAATEALTPNTTALGSEFPTQGDGNRTPVRLSSNGIDMTDFIPEGFRVETGAGNACNVLNGCISVNPRAQNTPEFPISVMHELGHANANSVGDFRQITALESLQRDLQSNLDNQIISEAQFLNRYTGLIKSKVPLVARMEQEAWLDALEQAPALFERTGLDPFAALENLPGGAKDSILSKYLSYRDGLIRNPEASVFAEGTNGLTKQYLNDAQRQGLTELANQEFNERALEIGDAVDIARTRIAATQPATRGDGTGLQLAQQSLPMNEAVSRIAAALELLTPFDGVSLGTTWSLKDLWRNDMRQLADVFDIDAMADYARPGFLSQEDFGDIVSALQRQESAESLGISGNTLEHAARLEEIAGQLRGTADTMAEAPAIREIADALDTAAAAIRSRSGDPAYWLTSALGDLSHLAPRVANGANTPPLVIAPSSPSAISAIPMSPVSVTSLRGAAPTVPLKAYGPVMISPLNVAVSAPTGSIASPVSPPPLPALDPNAPPFDVSQVDIIEVNGSAYYTPKGTDFAIEEYVGTIPPNAQPIYLRNYGYEAGEAGVYDVAGLGRIDNSGFDAVLYRTADVRPPSIMTRSPDRVINTRPPADAPGAFVQAPDGQLGWVTNSGGQRMLYTDLSGTRFGSYRPGEGFAGGGPGEPPGGSGMGASAEPSTNRTIWMRAKDLAKLSPLALLFFASDSQDEEVPVQSAENETIVPKSKPGLLQRVVSTLKIPNATQPSQETKAEPTQDSAADDLTQKFTESDAAKDSETPPAAPAEEATLEAAVDTAIKDGKSLEGIPVYDDPKNDKRITGVEDAEGEKHPLNSEAGKKLADSVGYKGPLEDTRSSPESTRPTVVAEADESAPAAGETPAPGGVKTPPGGARISDDPPAAGFRSPPSGSVPRGSGGGGFLSGGMSLLGGLWQGLVGWFTGGEEEPETPQPRQPTQSTQPPQQIVGAIVGNPSLIDSGTTTRLSWSSVGTDAGNSTCAVITVDFAVYQRGKQNGTITSPILTESTRFGLICDVNNAKDKLLNETLVRVRGDDTDPPRIFSPEQIAESQNVNSASAGTSAGSGTGAGVSTGGQSGNPTPEDVRTCDPEQSMDSFIRCLCEAEPNPNGCTIPPGGLRDANGVLL